MAVSGSFKRHECFYFSPHKLCVICYFSKISILQVIAAGMNPIQLTRGFEKTAKALVSKLKQMSREVYSISILLLVPWEGLQNWVEKKVWQSKI